MTNRPDALPAGTVLDRYRIESLLGEGGFGITYMASHTSMEQTVAIKEYLPIEFALRGEGDTRVSPRSHNVEDAYQWGLDRFLTEAKTLTNFVDHPNIVTVHDFFEHNDTAYLVMQYEEGLTFSQWIKQNPQPDEQTLLDIFLPVLDGLHAIHNAKFLHRDIKPGNIYIRNDGRPLLIDFGTAREALGEQSRSLSVVLSDGYAPKEQYSRRGNQGAWTDIYSVAATLWFAVTGKVPAVATDRAEARDEEESDPLFNLSEKYSEHYSEHFLKNIDWALAFSPKDRPQSVQLWQQGFLEPMSQSVDGTDPASRSEEKSNSISDEAVNQSVIKGNTPTKLKPELGKPPQKALLSETKPAQNKKSDLRRKKKFFAIAASLVICAGLLAAFYVLNLYPAGQKPLPQQNPSITPTPPEAPEGNRETTKNANTIKPELDVATSSTSVTGDVSPSTVNGTAAENESHANSGLIRDDKPLKQLETVDKQPIGAEQGNNDHQIVSDKLVKQVNAENESTTKSKEKNSGLIISDQPTTKQTDAGENSLVVNKDKELTPPPASNESGKTDSSNTITAPKPAALSSIEAPKQAPSRRSIKEEQVVTPPPDRSVLLTKTKIIFSLGHDLRSHLDKKKGLDEVLKKATQFAEKWPDEFSEEKLLAEGAVANTNVKLRELAEDYIEHMPDLCRMDKTIRSSIMNEIKNEFRTHPEAISVVREHLDSRCQNGHFSIDNVLDDFNKAGS